MNGDTWTKVGEAKKRSLWQERMMSSVLDMWSLRILKQRLLLRSWICSPGEKLNDDSDEEVSAKVMAEVMVMDEIAGDSIQKENKRHLWKEIPGSTDI